MMGAPIASGCGMSRTPEVQTMFEAVGRDLIETAVREHENPWHLINEVLGKLWGECTARQNAERIEAEQKAS